MQFLQPKVVFVVFLVFFTKWRLICSLLSVFHPILITRFASAIGPGTLSKKLHETLSLVGFITLKALSYSRIYIANVVFREYFVFCLQDKRVYCLAIKLRIQKTRICTILTFDWQN